MNLKDIIDFVKENKKLLDELKRSTGDVISDAKSILIENNKNRAAAFVAALDEEFHVEGGADRTEAIDVNIKELEGKLKEADDPLQEMSINHQLAQLYQIRANENIAKGFDSVVAFDDSEKEEIANLLKKIEADINARKNLKKAIDITVNVISIAAKIAGKAATHGLV